MKPFKPMKITKPWVPPQPELKAPSYLGSFLVYEAVFTLVSLLSVSAVMAIADFFGLKLVEGVAPYVSGAFIVFLFILLPRFLHRAALLRSQHSFGFRDGLRSAFVDVRLLLAGLPLIGLLFTPPPSYGKPENEDR